jgi:sigma-B regulation protein RsbU (phosphoserine phosphatase)
MLRSITYRLSLRVSLPLLISLLVLGSMSTLLVMFHVRTDKAVVSLAQHALQQVHDRIRESIRLAGLGPGPELDRLLASISLGEGAIAWVADREGRVVAASPLNSTAAGGPALAAAAAAWLAQTPGTGQVSKRVDLNGTDVVLMASPVHTAGWTLITVLPMDPVLAELRTQRREGIIFSAGAVLVAVVLGVLLAVYVARPVVALTEHVRNIGRGNLDEDILLTESPEFIRLSFAINSMVEGLRERLKLRQSLNMAKEVQRRLLPATVPDYPGLDVAGRSYYCDETGGDYFDYLRVGGYPDDTAVIALGDVSGHGIASAMVMASARGVLRSRCHDATSLTELLCHMNEQIVEDSGGGHYMTMLIVALNAARGELRWVNAGHCEPLLLEPGSGAFARLDGGGPPLGVIGGMEYEEYVHRDLEPGQILLLATDGLWEAANPAGEQFGMERLAKVLDGHAAEDAAAICAALAMAVVEFCGSREQKDDISFVVIKLV